MSDRVFSLAELDRAQEQFGLRFPSDLCDLLQDHGIPGGYDWAGDTQPIKSALSWPLEGLLFDVEENGLWWPEWGDRPTDEPDRAAVVAEVLDAAPKLIPLLGHRYLPEEPQVRGNPVFSVYQSDIIIYGASLADWMNVEFDRTYQTNPQWPVRQIEFWSLTVERGHDEQFYPYRDSDEPLGDDALASPS